MPVTQEQIESLKDARPNFRWKVQSTQKWGCDCVAYVDARQVMDLLDEVVGSTNWQDHYREVAGKVYCDLSFFVQHEDGSTEWVTKSDCGTESQFEGEKGQASDAFKRAAVKWGACRFLYALDIVKVKSLENGTDNKGKPRYVPADDNGKRIYNLTAYIQGLQGQQAPPPATPAQKEDIKTLCQELGWTGEQFSAYLKRLGASWNKLTKQQAAKALNELDEIKNSREKALA